MKKYLSLLFIHIIIFSFAQTKGKFTDARDGKTYKTVVIGTQTWMSENLNVSTFQNGDIIPEAKNIEEWRSAVDENRPAWCYYDFDSKNGDKYGKLYNWFAVIDKRGLSPVDWKVPSDDDWVILEEFLGGVDVAGSKMRDTTGWANEDDATNESGFSGLPGGSLYFAGTERDFSGLPIEQVNFEGYFKGIGSYGDWWSTTDYGDANGIAYRWLIDNFTYLSTAYTNKYKGMAVRCIKD